MPLRIVATDLLVPPFSLVLVILAGLLLRRRRRLSGSLLTWSGVLGLLLLAVPAVGESLVLLLERDLPLTSPTDRPPKAIVILGGEGARGASPQLAIANLGPYTLERVRAAAELYRHAHLPILTSGGSARSDEPPLADVMADSLTHDFQVPVRWSEPVSRDTWENARLSAGILRAQGISSVYVVTHGWHMRRAIIAFEQAGIAVTAVPVRLDAPPKWEAWDLVPCIRGWQTSYFALHEWIGYAYYVLR